MQTFQGSIVKVIGDVIAAVITTVIIAVLVYIFTDNIKMTVIVGAVALILTLLVFVSGDMETLTVDDQYVKMYSMFGKLEWELDRSKVDFRYGAHRGLMALGDGISKRISLNSFSTKTATQIFEAIGAEEMVYKLN